MKKRKEREFHSNGILFHPFKFDSKKKGKLNQKAILLWQVFYYLCTSQKFASHDVDEFQQCFY